MDSTQPQTNIITRCIHDCAMYVHAHSRAQTHTYIHVHRFIDRQTHADIDADAHKHAHAHAHANKYEHTISATCLTPNEIFVPSVAKQKDDRHTQATRHCLG